MAKKEEKEVKKVKRPTALKRDIQNEKRRLINRTYKSRVKTAIRNFEETLEGADQAKAQEQLSAVYSLIDKCVKTGVIKRNTASRTKSRLTVRAAAKA
jgi:small subunit ribosomal protein S20